MSVNTITPLRYPGGKTSLFNKLSIILDYNGLYDCTYIEPYAGGAGAALKLLDKDKVNKIVINDLDKHIYYFWITLLKKKT